MTYIITIWLMTSPGTWDRTVLQFETHEACHRAIGIFQDRQPPVKPWRFWYEGLIGSSDGELIFEDGCG